MNVLCTIMNCTVSSGSLFDKVKSGNIKLCCCIFLASKIRTEEKERRDEDSERGDEDRERRYRERKVHRVEPEGRLAIVHVCRGQCDISICTYSV